MNLSFRLDFYRSSRTPCIIVIDSTAPNEVFGKLSLFTPNATLNDNEFVVKNYSENQSWYDLALSAYNHKYFEYTGKRAYLPHNTCPIYRITPAFINEQFEATYNPRTDIYECNDILFKLHEKYCEGK